MPLRLHRNVSVHRIQRPYLSMMSVRCAKGTEIHLPFLLLLLLSIVITNVVGEKSLYIMKSHHNLRKFRPVFVPSHGAGSTLDAGVPLEYYTSPALDPNVYMDVVRKTHQDQQSSGSQQNVASITNPLAGFESSDVHAQSPPPSTYFSLV